MKYIALFETDEHADGVGVVFPDLPVSKPCKYSIYMNRSLMKRIDAITNNLSAFLARAAEMALESMHS